MTGTADGSPTLDVVRSCLGYVPEFVGHEFPPVYFDGRVGGNFEGSDAEAVRDESRATVRRQVAHAYSCCVERFPLSVRNRSTGDVQPTVTAFSVGRSTGSGMLLSASSPQAPGVIFLAADWPLSNPYWLASLIAHESTHQALYFREAESSPVRPSSLGYSPWKRTLRPGRWVWHAFWTFSCQLAMLGEALATEQQLLADEPPLVVFVADMQARVELCLRSLIDSNIVISPEIGRCQAALNTLDRLTGGLPPGFAQAKETARSAVFEEYREWADAMVSQPEGSRD
ncbi:hypothetical protein ACZ90_11465 [Streptomyces albus subsp. albus]|nr:hypothetical protein ACZ90_11465 [Streptomyces albus subsp. albus]